MYYKKARYGYARGRGRGSYDYVRKIESRYRAYAALLDTFRKQQEAVRWLNCAYAPEWLLDDSARCRFPEHLAGSGGAQQAGPQ
ncbi:hypothetical protein [Microbulbifer magnicolonia]|uniref:hypothetical protein n=1 Tax=Microbulbifer magnicolonia TaxID=3109744 RepID=UPI002B403980|nr:hypothetical protein [Microbulbifer sp. GG15]